jgi:hypothetical protein
MSIASPDAEGSLAWTQAAVSVICAPKAAKGPGPDHDGDADDSWSVSSQRKAASATTPSVGIKVNMRA